MGTRRVIILGSTGSIGTQTLEVIEHLNALHSRGESPDRFEVVGLSARRNGDLARAQAQRFHVRHLALEESTAENDLGRAAEHLVRSVECDLVVAAIVGVAGLRSTLAAVELGRDVALANKESLVAAGELVIPAARRTGARLLPLDSEHSGLWQCLWSAGQRGASLADIGAGSRACDAAPRLGLAQGTLLITASGGPFRTWTREEMDGASPEQALKHPTWSMGRKVTIDTATLMNKGLEVMEAAWLFGVEPARIRVLVHPQSLVHALVEFADGSVIAQIGAADMRTPIQVALSWPRRVPGAWRRMAWDELRKLEFEAPDLDRFPALGLAFRALERGGTAGAVMNAANEVAVNAFLERAPCGNGGPLRFGRLGALVAGAMDAIPPRPIHGLDDVFAADRAARSWVSEAIARGG